MDKFTQAYKSNYSYIYNILCKRINNKSDAEDICQEIFFNLYSNIDKVYEGSQKAWLISAMRNRLLNYYAKDNRVVIENLEDHEYHKNLQFVNGARDIRIILKEAIENDENFVNEEEKIIFEMIAIFEYSYKEVEKRLGQSKRQIEYKFEQTSKRILHYLKKKGLKKEDINE